MTTAGIDGACVAQHPMRCRRRLLLLAGVALLSVVIAGCATPEARHKVLTFFFTGVPPLGAEPEEVSRSEKATVVKVIKQQSVVVTSTRFGHGPYAADGCYLCHETSASGGFRGFGKKQEAQGALAEAGQVSGKLLAPMGELCASCHESKSIARAAEAGLWVHGPVSTGYCTLCHGPHSGPEQYMLDKPSDALCVDCHTHGLTLSLTEHQGRMDCVTCHNAHLGKDSRLLRADYVEAW